VFAIVAMHCGTCACAMAAPSSSLLQRAELRSIERRIDDDAAHTRMRNGFPEGGLFTLSFTGFAIANIAAANPDDNDFHAHAGSELAKLLALSEAERDVEPFRSWGARNGRWRGVILEGHQNLLRAAYVSVGGDDPTIVTAFHTTSAQLASLFALA